MTIIEILDKGLKDQEVEAIKALLAEAGCDKQPVELTTSISSEHTDGDDVVVLILATQTHCGLPDLEQELSHAMNGTCRVIWLWPEDNASAEIPEATKKYSYSVVPWDSGKLAAAIADDDVTCFELPTGDPMPKVEMEHNLCVEDQKTPTATK